MCWFCLSRPCVVEQCVRPVIHWSESREGPRRAAAHSEYITRPLRLHGLEGVVDVMLEAKGHEQALLRVRELATRTRLEATKSREMLTGAAAKPCITRQREKIHLLGPEQVVSSRVAPL